LINRKGIVETIDAFCNAFTNNDKVILFVKTFFTTIGGVFVRLELIGIADRL
jgi:hypothetical protein